MPFVEYYGVGETVSAGSVGETGIVIVTLSGIVVPEIGVLLEIVTVGIIVTELVA